MRHVTDNRMSKYQFDSLAELSRWISGTRPTWRYRSSVTQEATSGWDLSAGYDGALRMAHVGWIEGAQRAWDNLNQLNPKEPAPALRTDFYGHMPHVPRFCAGAPDSMIRHHHTPTVGNGCVLTLYVPVSANCSQKAQYMSNFGIGLAHYVEQLERDGMRVELYACMTLDRYHDKRLSIAWLVKNADQPVDLAVLAFSIGHPAAFRRLGFAVIERSDVPQVITYGHATNAKLSDFIDPPSGAYILNGLLNANANAVTPKAASEYIAEQIERALDVPDADAI